tara:strand:+ start:322 stop:654 length:333 start_codon:yes stop_codon:yes gene_type:complete
MATNDFMVSDSLKGLFDENPKKQSHSFISVISPIHGKLRKIYRSKDTITFSFEPDEIIDAVKLIDGNNISSLIIRYMEFEKHWDLIEPKVSIDISSSKHMTVHIESKDET